MSYNITNGIDMEGFLFASCLKHSIYGDINLTRLEEVQRLLEGDVSGRVQR